MRINERKTAKVTDPNEYLDSPGYPPQPGDRGAKPDAAPSAKPEAAWAPGEFENAADPDPYGVMDDLIWDSTDEELDFPPPIPYCLETRAPAPVAQDSGPAEMRESQNAALECCATAASRKAGLPAGQKPAGLANPENRSPIRSEVNGDVGDSPTAAPPPQSVTQPESPLLVAMRKGKVDEHLNPVDFCLFLGSLGYRRWLGNGSCELILPHGYILERVDMLRAKEHVESIIQSHDFLQAVKDKVFRRLKEFFKAKNLTSLPEFEGDFLTDSRDRCYKPYLNCVVEIAPDGCRRIWYNQLDKYVWKTDIIPRVFDRSGNWQSGIYYRFTQNQCTDPLRKGPDGQPLYDFARHRAYLASIGYNLHGFKTRLQPCLTIYSDATEGDRERNGGSGKSLIIQLLNAMQGAGADAAHRIVTETGESLKRDYNHNFDQVTPHTRVVVIDDLDTRRFPLENVYSWVTVGMTINKKGQESRFLPFEQAPKCVVTSNNPVSGTRDSDLRRRMDVQLFRHYNAAHKPIDDFGRGFFGEGFNAQDWAEFDSFAIACIQIALRCDVATKGLPAYVNNVLESSLELEIGDDLVEFLDRLILPAIGKFGSAKEDAKGLKSSFEEEYGVKRKESSRKFNSRLKRYGELRKLEVDTRPSGGTNWVEFKRLV
ncbi:MAG: hypothetical protein LHW57_03610 [Candidatus Cloacimonetes bacterium]|nr:hypothetical protein [Candidatus Cloacimonadota bacterium]